MGFFDIFRDDRTKSIVDPARYDGNDSKSGLTHSALADKYKGVKYKQWYDEEGDLCRSYNGVQYYYDSEADRWELL